MKTLNLKDLREKAGLTQEQTADKIGTHKQQIYNFETGRSPVPLKYISKYAAALKLPKNKLLAFCLEAKNQKLLAKVK